MSKLEHYTIRLASKLLCYLKHRLKKRGLHYPKRVKHHPMCAACAKGKATRALFPLLKVDMLISATSFDDIDPDTAPSNHIPNIHTFQKMSIVPNVPPDPTCLCPHQPNHHLFHMNHPLTISNPLIEVTPHSSKGKNLTQFHSQLVNWMQM